MSDEPLWRKLKDELKIFCQICEVEILVLDLDTRIEIQFEKITLQRTWRYFHVDCILIKMEKENRKKRD